MRAQVPALGSLPAQKMERCKIDDYSSILQRPLEEVLRPMPFKGLITLLIPKLYLLFLVGQPRICILSNFLSLLKC